MHAGAERHTDKAMCRERSVNLVPVLSVCMFYVAKPHILNPIFSKRICCGLAHAVGCSQPWNRLPSFAMAPSPPHRQMSHLYSFKLYPLLNYRLLGTCLVPA